MNTYITSYPRIDLYRCDICESEYREYDEAQKCVRSHPICVICKEPFDPNLYGTGTTMCQDCLGEIK